ncbi:MAG: hypothetical protein E7495_00495 [Ruminococcus flavefaciens]|jgi:predicted small lipoprotein YifL|nr:hypothetical protein [Ruminococcus flavefaciens]
MKRIKSKIVLALTVAVCSLTGCGKVGSGSKNDVKNNADTSALTTASASSESASTIVTTLADKTEAASAVQSESKADALTEEQALDAIKNYCFSRNPGLKDMVESGEYNIYWNVISNDANEIVVLYRAYTSAQMRYYISKASGETYVTELVPGIIDEEQRTDENFNIRDYL